MIDLIGNRTLRDLLDERVELHPNKTWLVFEDRHGHVTELSYLQFADLVDRAVRGFAAVGIGHGDAVVVHLRNCPEFLVAWFGLASIGAVMVPSNVANTARELEHILQHSEAVAVLTQADFLDLFLALREARRLKTLILACGGKPPADVVAFEDLLEPGGPASVPVAAVQPEDVLEMMFTSGTTAAPKAVLLTHANALRSGERAVNALALDSNDRCLTCLPVFHVNAQSLTILGALTAGATTILLEEFSASSYWEQVRRHGATQTSLVAMQARTLLAQPPTDTDGQHQLRRVMYAINVTDGEKEAFEERFGVRFINGYGLSEAMTLVTITPVFGRQRWPSIGLPAFDRSVRIVDEHGDDMPVGEVGEIIVSGIPGRTVMKGYFKDPDATANVLRGGWLYTGDNGYVDEPGYFYFFDRKKDVIKRAGENISASEVEAVLVEHPAIAEAAVIGVPDPVRDEAVKAFIVTTEGQRIDVDQVKEHCAKRLASFKVPSHVEMVAGLPKTSIGKIEKKILRGWAEADQ